MKFTAREMYIAMAAYRIGVDSDNPDFDWHDDIIDDAGHTVEEHIAGLAPGNGRADKTGADKIMARKFKLEFSMDGIDFLKQPLREVVYTLSAVSGDISRYMVYRGNIRDSNGNTIGHFEIVETDESEG